MTDKPPLRMQIRLNHKPETIFTALTDSRALETWFAEHAEVDLAAKRYDFWGRFTPENPNREAGRHDLLAVQPDHSLKYAWQWGDQPTTVEMTLHPRGAQTILAVEHIGGHPGSHQTNLYTLEDVWFLSLENLRRYLDGKPCESRVDFSQPMVGEIRHSIDIDASTERVFEVLTRPDELERWMASKARVEPHKGGDYDIGWGVPVKIVEIEAGRRLAFELPIESGQNHIVTWSLEETGSKTRLTIVHSGFAPDEANGGLKAGWRNFIGWVRSVSEYGPDWEPALVPLVPEFAMIYPAAIARAQGELVWT